LARAEAASAMRTIMEGEATHAQIAAFLIALKLKGETAAELAGFVDVMREKAVPVRLDDPDAVDLCGTGGDSSGTFNISTVAAFVVAGAGVTVAKHGNRSVSSTCGSADLLQALGVNIDLAPAKVEECINRAGIGFLFAPLFHPAMRHAAVPRSELGVKTCFNMLGPLTNPARVRRQLVGAFSPAAARLIAEVFAGLDPLSVMVVHSEDGLDEISLAAPTLLHRVGPGNARTTGTIAPGEFALPASAAKLAGGGPHENARIARAILGGEKGPERDVVVANAAAALHVAGRSATLADGAALAAESIDSGKASGSLALLVAETNR
jgi:anthranilate phosphoribosyltransferase